ncbi:glutathione S-transferase [Sorangium cellulosum]|uniref:Glutathione S-transferase n=1 Tax=Sorangium cellulosum TaxID=56 RepID=A0A4P2PSP7_SORCE|nr:glutathione S-transferase family protein [Sorangium cellulosum]AUX19589.1 glutathione S-transferase [Sorangium cellulosum]
MKLYIVPGSPNCRKVQAVVHELPVPVETVIVDFAAGAHKSRDYLAINPNGLVPSLVDGDLRLWESNAIMQYLADAHDAISLFPRDPRRRIDVVRWQCWELSHFGRALGVVLFERLFKPLMGGQPDEALAQRALEQLQPYAALLDAHVKERAFVAGDAVTLADYSLGCQLPMAALGRINLAPYPNLRAWLARLDEREAWRATAMPAAMAQAIEQATAAHRSGDGGS